MKISLCMITKNEESLLANCLNSVEKYVDEIIIVDTGSTDNTCKIALSYGAKIYHKAWENNFAKARNFGVNKAKGEWILFIDADETLEHGELLKSLIDQADEDITGYLFNICNYFNEQKTQIERSISLRLFRNKSEMRFSGAIHEQLPIKDKSVILTDLTIHHYGYIPSISINKEKSKRNLAILEQEIRYTPKDSFVNYNLGSEYVRLHQYEKAIPYFKEALKNINEESGYEARLYKMLGICYFAKKEWADAIAIISAGINKFPDYPDLFYLRGLSYEETENFLEAIIDFLTCLTLDNKEIENNKMYVIEDGITSYKAYYSLGRVYEKSSKIQEALTAYIRALKTNSRFIEPIKRIEKIFNGNLDTLQQFFEKKVFSQKSNNKNDKEHLEENIKENIAEKVKYAQIFMELEHYQITLNILNSIDNLKQDDRIKYILGVSHFKLNNFNHAINHLSQIKKEANNFAEAIPYLISCFWITGDVKKAKQLLAKTTSSNEIHQKIAAIFYDYGEEMLEQGLGKYPNSLTLQKEYERIKKVKNDVKISSTT